MKCGRLDLTSFDLSHRQSNYGRLRAGVASTRPRYLVLLTLLFEDLPVGTTRQEAESSGFA